MLSEIMTDVAFLLGLFGMILLGRALWRLFSGVFK